MGLWMNCDSPLMAEFGAKAGFDWVLLDGQHGNWDYPSLVAATQVISATATVPVARVARNDPALIGRILDLGMMGVVVPSGELGGGSGGSGGCKPLFPARAPLDWRLSPCAVWR